MLVPFWYQIGFILVSVWSHAGVTVGVMLVSFWYQFGFMLVSCLVAFLVSCWYHGGVMGVSFWCQFGIMLVSFWFHVGISSVSYWYKFGIIVGRPSGDGIVALPSSMPTQ